MIAILLNTSTFSYWTKTCHVSKNIKKYLNDVVVRGRQNLFLFRLRRNFFLLEKKNSKWNDYHSFKEKHWFFYWTRTRHVSQNLKNTLTMLSSEVDRICSSSVWDETSFCWNKKTVNKMIIILSKTSTFSYWTRTCHVPENLKTTFTMFSSEVDRICPSSVWEETSFCWNRRTVNELIIILLKTSTFSYWTTTYHAWKNLTIP